MLAAVKVCVCESAACSCVCDVRVYACLRACSCVDDSHPGEQQRASEEIMEREGKDALSASALSLKNDWSHAHTHACTHIYIHIRTTGGTRRLERCESQSGSLCVCACARACVCVCVRACVRACACACARNKHQRMQHCTTTIPINFANTHSLFPYLFFLVLSPTPLSTISSMNQPQEKRADFLQAFDRLMLKLREEDKVPHSHTLMHTHTYAHTTPPVECVTVKTLRGRHERKRRGSEKIKVTQTLCQQRQHAHAHTHTHTH